MRWPKVFFNEDAGMTELATKTDLIEALDKQTLRLTVRLGAMIVLGAAALAIFRLS